MTLSKPSPARKKVIHIITGLEVGGAEMNLARLLPALNQHHDNIVCCLTQAGPVSHLLQEGKITVFYLGAQKRVTDFFNPVLIKKFYTFIRREKPDVMITYLIHADLFGRFWGKLFGVPRIISWNRGSLLEWQWLSFFDRWSAFLVDCYIFQTNAMRNQISRAQHISLSKTAVIPNAVDTPMEFSNTNRQTLLSSFAISNPNLPTLICVANLRKGKGHTVLIRAFENAVKKSGPANLLIVGEGEQKPILQTLTAQTSVSSSIFFLGHQNNIPALLKASDIFILPTFYEGMSNAILEALFYGCPVITTDIPVNQEIIRDGTSGLLVPVRNEDALTDAIVDLMHSPEKQERFQQAGLSFIAQNCTPAAVSEKLSILISH